jgi:DtxR family Mn-dependent transcriptional regulator
MNESISRAQQDYIKAIWKFEQSAQPAKMSTVADILGVKPPTVLAMFRQLDRRNLIDYDKQCGAVLTERGRREAENLIRKHRLIETFLNRVLKIEEPLLHDEAEKLEHVMSDQLIMKIDKYLNYPRFDRHGSIIPLSGTGDIKYLLSEIEESIPFTVIKIPMSGDEKKYCSDHNFLPGSDWRIKTISPGNDSFLVTNGKHYFALSDHLAQKITVTVVRK